MLSRGMRDKPIQYRSGRGEGTAILRVRLSTEHCQSFFINATSKLVTKLQATCDLLIQHFNRISKLRDFRRNFPENPIEDFCANFLNFTRLHYQLLSPQRPRSRSSREQLLILADTRRYECQVHASLIYFLSSWLNDSFI